MEPSKEVSVYSSGEERAQWPGTVCQSPCGIRKVTARQPQCRVWGTERCRVSKLKWRKKNIHVGGEDGPSWIFGALAK